MPYGSWINELPTSFFLAVHIAAFTIGASFAWATWSPSAGAAPGAGVPVSPVTARAEAGLSEVT